MNFLKKLIGKNDVFFDLLEAGAEEARVSVDLFAKFLAQIGDGKQPAGLDDFIQARRKEKRIRHMMSEELSRTFEDVQGYDDIVMLRDIEVESHCEHHMAPFLGKAYVAYVPNEKVVGISKLARVVEIFAKRLQTQETLTQQIADAITDNLKPAGVAVLIDAKHECMTTRGVHHRHVSTITTQFTGVFKSDPALQERFLNFCNRK